MRVVSGIFVPASGSPYATRRIAPLAVRHLHVVQTTPRPRDRRSATTQVSEMPAKSRKNEALSGYSGNGAARPIQLSMSNPAMRGGFVHQNEPELTFCFLELPRFVFEKKESHQPTGRHWAARNMRVCSGWFVPSNK